MIGLLIIILSMTIPTGLLFMCLYLKEEWGGIKEAVLFGGHISLFLTIAFSVIIAAVKSFQYGLSLLQ